LCLTNFSSPLGEEQLILQGTMQRYIRDAASCQRFLSGKVNRMTELETPEVTAQ
jgi:hypothetical protein